MGAKSGRNKRGGGAKKAAAPKNNKGGGVSRAQRVGLVLFAVVFIALFVVFAVAEGLGKPSVPSGDVALVTGIPSETGHISEAQYKNIYARQVAQGGLKKAPKEGSKKAEELHETSMGELLTAAWIFGEAEEMGIKVTNKEVETELAKVKKESFKTEKAFQEFLKEQHFTEEEVNKQIELQLLETKLTEKVKKETPPVTEGEAKAYYEKEVKTAYTKKPSRDVRVIVNENKKEVEAAQKALEADNSEASWKKVTKKYSPTTATNGGLQKEISEEFLTEPLKKDIFGAATGELIGPVKQEKNYLLLEVVKLHPETVESFEKVEETIKSTLTSTNEEKFFQEWLKGFQTKWRARSFCASGFITEQCANFKGDGHPAEAEAACYEANPTIPAKECPAPVTQNKPALPGTVSEAKPEGEAFVQRPQPEEFEAEIKKEEEAKKKAEEAKAKKSKGSESSGKESEGSEASSAETEAAVKAAEEAAAEAAAEGEK